MHDNRAAPHMEIPALFISFVLAPGAPLAVAFVAWPVGALVGQWLGIISPDGDPADRGQFLIPLAGTACAGFWLLSLPVLLTIRAMGKLSFWTVIPPAVALPSAVVASSALAAWAANGKNPLPWFVTATLVFVPETVTLATAFWAFYCFFTGHRFLTPPPWRRATGTTDEVHSPGGQA